MTQTSHLTNFSLQANSSKRARSLTGQAGLLPFSARHMAETHVPGIFHSRYLLGRQTHVSSLSEQTLLRSSLRHSLLMGGRLRRAHLLCFIISPMEKQTSLCFSSERCFTSGPTSSFRRSICSRVCWTKYPTAPCWDGSKAWICCKMSRTFSNQNKNTGSEQASRATQHLKTHAGVFLKAAGAQPRPRGLSYKFSTQEEPLL